MENIKVIEDVSENVFGKSHCFQVRLVIVHCQSYDCMNIASRCIMYTTITTLIGASLSEPHTSGTVLRNPPV